MEECTHSSMNGLLSFLRKTTYTGGELDATRGEVVVQEIVTGTRERAAGMSSDEKPRRSVTPGFSSAKLLAGMPSFSGDSALCAVEEIFSCVGNTHFFTDV